MTLSVDELETLFDDEFRKHPSARRMGKRAGIRAVVTALRDEMDDKGHYEIHLMFNEILGDAGEKVAEGIAERADEQRADAPATALEALAGEVERLTINGIHSCWEECPRLPCVQGREIRALKAELAALRAAGGGG